MGESISTPAPVPVAAVGEDGGGVEGPHAELHRRLLWLAAFRVAAVVMLLATAGLIVQFVRARRLADVAGERRLPQGARRPRLLLALARPS